jgi:hypothetical protein
MNYYTKKLITLENTEAQYFGLFSAVYKNDWGVHLDGYWERKDGSEGGELTLWVNNDDRMIEVLEFDGAYDLPSYVKDELKKYGIVCDW